jgi:alpha-beta hydrolase superfamily lysophospholipase
MKAQDYTVSRNGYNVSCKLYYEDKKAIPGVVLFGHGFGGHKDNKAAERFAQRALDKLRFATVTFNWPCHGDDVRKKLRLADCDGYLTAVMEDIRERYGSPRLYAYATSFGGFLFLKYISEHGNPFARMALRSPAVDLYRIQTERILSPEDLERLQRSKEVMAGFDRKVALDREYLNEIQAVDLRHRDFTPFMDDIIILHGVRDEIVPLETVRAFADDQLIEFIPIDHADHRFQDPRAMDEAIKAMVDFFGSA